MVKSGLVSTMIFSFILSWNDFMYALVLTGSRTRLVSVAVAQFLTPHGMFWGQMCAAGIIAILPILIFTLFARRLLVRGMSMGAIK
jgi:multiple sugar transport system permease protein